MRLRCIREEVYRSLLSRTFMCRDYSRREIGLCDLTRAARVFLIDYFKAAIPQEMDGHPRHREIKAPRFPPLAFLLFYYFCSFFFCRGTVRSAAPLNYMVRHGLRSRLRAMAERSARSAISLMAANRTNNKINNGALCTK